MSVILNPHQRSWIVGTSSSPGQISIASTPKQHDDLPSAVKEAERLAISAYDSRNNTGKKYVVLEVVAYAEVSAPKKKGF